MPCGLLYYVHIPKTGGSTVFNRLKGIEGGGSTGFTGAMTGTRRTSG